MKLLGMTQEHVEAIMDLSRKLLEIRNRQSSLNDILKGYERQGPGTVTVSLSMDGRNGPQNFLPASRAQQVFDALKDMVRADIAAIHEEIAAMQLPT